MFWNLTGGFSGKDLTQGQEKTPAGESRGVLGTQERALGGGWDDLLFHPGDNT